MPDSLFEGIPTDLPEELFSELLRGRAFRVERILSRGHCSPEGFWYDQEESEWVLLVAGAAIVRFEGRPEAVTLGPGDHLLIPAHARHRVDWTAPDRDTVWLAIHFDAGPHEHDRA